MKISDLSNAERETHLNMMADDRSMWHVFSDDPILMRKLENQGAILVRKETYGGCHYTLEANQVRFFKPMSEEQKRRNAENLSNESDTVKRPTAVTSEE